MCYIVTRMRIPMSTDSPVNIVDYDPAWPERFSMLAASYDSMLGAVPRRIEHIGSTSVPGLAAKPIIDIIIVISSMKMFPSIGAALATLGYEHNGDQDVPGREVFKLQREELLARHLGGVVPAHHLYVCPEVGDNLNRMLLFRDYLKAHREAALEYGELKKRLAIRYRNDRPGYTDAKSDFIRAIVEPPAGQ